MEILLAIVVASAVIFFGALISMGNERQRKAIERLREQVVHWAVQDLKIKRERLVREIKIDNPLDWINQIIKTISGDNYDIKMIEAFETPQTLVCISGDGNRKIAFTPVSISEVRKLSSNKKNRLTDFSSQNPLINSTRFTKVIEVSLLNTDILFDLEFKLVWEAVTGFKLNRASIIWMYVF